MLIDIHLEPSPRNCLDVEWPFSCLGVGKLAGLFSIWRPVIRRKAIASSREKASIRKSVEIFFFIQIPLKKKGQGTQKFPAPPQVKQIVLFNCMRILLEKKFLFKWKSVTSAFVPVMY